MTKPTANSKGQIAKSSSEPKTSRSNTPATTMAELMKSAKGPLSTLQKGQTIEGVITRTTPEIYVDIKAKTHAMVLEKDRKILRALLSHFKVGDTVEVSVLSPESEFGYPVVSLRRYLDSITWEQLQNIRANKQTVEVTVQSKTAGGYLVATDDGVAGFLPNSQSQLFDDSINKKIDVYVLELSRDTKKVIFSQKPLLSREEFEKAARKFKIGEKVKGKVTSVTSFGIFVTVDSEVSLDGLIHISELAWENPEEALSDYSAGREVEAKIIGFEPDAKRLDLSIKQLTSDPFEELMNQYRVDQKVNGTVKEIISSGVKIDVSAGIEGPVLNGVEGLIRKDKIPPNVSYTVGQEIAATISEIDKKKHRLVLVPVLKEKPIGYR